MNTVNWEELARQGNTVAAILAYRQSTGVNLAEAKQAIEHWLAINFPPSQLYEMCSRIGERVYETLSNYQNATGQSITYSISLLPAASELMKGHPALMYARLSVEERPLDLAVEIGLGKLPSKVRNSIVDERLASGVQMVWVIETDFPTIHVCTERDSNPIFHRGATFDCGHVFPGFTCKVADLFT